MRHGPSLRGGCNTLGVVGGREDQVDEAGPPSLWIQTVLYRQTTSEISGLVRGLSAAARFARVRGAYRSIKLTLGDSSARPSISPEFERELAAKLPESGIDEFRYVFYDENQGSAAGQNTLFDLRDRDSDFVFVMNPDVYVCPDVFTELFTVFGEFERGHRRGTTDSIGASQEVRSG